MDIVIRPADPSESEAAAGVLITSRHASVPAIPPLVHDDHDVIAWFHDTVMATKEVWVAAVGTAVVGVMVIADGWIEQLYVDPAHTRQGIGARLLDQAKSTASGDLELWTFVTNTGARRFYERHGFVVVDGTDGDNEEGAPDLRYRWSP